MKHKTQRGATLLVAMVMLVVLTLLVVYAIRSGITNLTIAGNMQLQTESTAVGQQAIDTVVEAIKVDSVDISAYTPPPLNVSVNGKSYTVTPTLSSCVLEVPIMNSDLNPANANDVPCFESPDQDSAITAAGTLTSRPSACKNQQWEIRASIADADTGVNATVVQGVSARVPSTTNCL